MTRGRDLTEQYAHQPDRSDSDAPWPDDMSTMTAPAPDRTAEVEALKQAIRDLVAERDAARGVIDRENAELRTLLQREATRRRVWCVVVVSLLREAEGANDIDSWDSVVAGLDNLSAEMMEADR